MRLLGSRSLQGRLTTAVLGYLVLLTVVVLLYGWIINERAEALVWKSLLETEMNNVLGHADDPGWKLPASGLFEFHDDGDGVHPFLPMVGLSPGIHDEIKIGDRYFVALVQVHDGRRFTLALDITEFERDEHDLMLLLFLSGFVVVSVLGLAVGWGVARLARPLQDLALRISSLRPDTAGQQIEMAPNSTDELTIIGNSVNDYLRRHDRFVERERTFIDAASHELRTPISVIAGAAELALESEVPASARAQLHRIGRTTQAIEQLIAMLLALAKDPARLALSSDRIELDQLIPEIANDHAHLCGDKALSLHLEAMPHCQILAPVGIVQATVGNLLRNAIENSDSGDIHIRLDAYGAVVIDDPGHGMSPEQISAIYARQARGDARGGGGIGLELITRLCSHMGWHLAIAPHPGRRGTRALLDMRSSVIRSAATGRRTETGSAAPLPPSTAAPHDFASTDENVP